MTDLDMLGTVSFVFVSVLVIILVMVQDLFKDTDTTRIVLTTLSVTCFAGYLFNMKIKDVLSISFIIALFFNFFGNYLSQLLAYLYNKAIEYINK